MANGPRDWDVRCKVYVGGLGSNGTKYDLEMAFNKYGPLRNVWVARNPPGFAFIEFEDPRDAEDAVRGLDGTRICGARARVEMSSGRPKRGGGGGGGGGGGRGGRGGGGGGGPRRPRESWNNSRNNNESFSPRRRSRSRSRSREFRRERSYSRD